MTNSKFVRRVLIILKFTRINKKKWFIIYDLITLYFVELNEWQDKF